MWIRASGEVGRIGEGIAESEAVPAGGAAILRPEHQNLVGRALDLLHLPDALRIEEDVLGAIVAEESLVRGADPANGGEGAGAGGGTFCRMGHCTRRAGSKATCGTAFVASF